MNEVKVNERQNSLPELSLENRMEIIHEGIRKEYLSRLDAMEIAPFEKFPPLTEDTIENIRIFKISEIVYQKGESVQDKLTTVFNTLSPFNVTLFLLMDSDGKKTDFYLGMRNDEISGPHKRSTVSLGETLRNALTGHFPGIRTENTDRAQIAALSRKIQNQKNAAAVSVLPNVKNEKKNSDEQFVQGMEKLIFAMSGRPYTAILVAQSQPSSQIQQMRHQYMELYSALSPYAKIQKSRSDSTGVSRQKSFNEMNPKQKTSMISSALIGVAGSIIGTAIGGPMGAMIGGQTGGQLSSFITSLAPQEQITKNVSNTIGSTVENKMVTELLKDLDRLIEQTYEFDSFGMWNAAAYFLSDEMSNTEIASSNFRSLMNGEHSGKQVSSIGLWRQAVPGYENLTGYLSRFTHPKFLYGESSGQVVLTDAGVPMSGKNIGLFLGLPRQTVAGLPVLEHAQFGKEVVSTSFLNRKELMPDERMTLGRVIDMGVVSDKLVELSNKSLNMHTFITGSTGSGKSNTVYQMLCELAIDNIPFLVIEPAKGEYKDAFGSWPSVSVFSTNPKEAALIHLNPFRFPDSVHVLEHVDGLIEIFSACWPMYDAMPAFFKSAVLAAYEKCGWDLASSSFEGKEVEYPDFEMLAEQLDELIGESEYSSEIKSNYRGALLTRVRSLATGLNRFIFTREQTPLEVLFDSNCILDISRIRSTETKALIMGVMVYMLNEYRQDQRTESNSGLRHVTVLEEAHNLLKNTEGGSSELVGKSVEMLTSTIAEIRTYGEGFIIVDQSPSAVDITAIKNTNTKIVLRTPEANDREAVGKSMGLDPSQINEIAKLSSGAAVVFQNDWASPVLTMINKAPVTEVPYKPSERTSIMPASRARRLMVEMLLDPWLDKDPIAPPALREALNVLQIDRKTRTVLEDFIEKYDLMNRMLVLNSEEISKVKNLAAEVIGLSAEKICTAESAEDLTNYIEEKLRCRPKTAKRIMEILCMKGEA